MNEKKNLKTHFTERKPRRVIAVNRKKNTYMMDDNYTSVVVGSSGLKGGGKRTDSRHLLQLTFSKGMNVHVEMKAEGKEREVFFQNDHLISLDLIFEGDHEFITFLGAVDFASRQWHRLTGYRDSLTDRIRRIFHKDKTII